MSKIILLQGIPGSGKSTIAADYASKGFQVVNADAFRYTLGITHNGDGWTQSKEYTVKMLKHHSIEHHMHLGLDIVVDETHTTMHSISPILAMAKRFGYDTALHRVWTDLDECIRRRCPDGFPENVVRRMYKNLQMFPSIGDIVPRKFSNYIVTNSPSVQNCSPV